MIRIPRSELVSIISADPEAVSSTDRDEMAIPAYLHYNPLVRYLMWRRYATVESLMRCPREEPVLEFGCGAGLFLATLCEGHDAVFATDLFPLFAQKLVRERDLPVTFVDGVESVEDGSLGSIIAADVLEHVDDLDHYLALFAAKLKDGGELLVSGPTESVAYKAGRFVAGFSWKGDYHHRDVAYIADAADRVFDRTETVCLPFPVGPHLFEVYRFARRPAVAAEARGGPAGPAAE